MQKFIARQNISHFARLLEREKDPARRKLLNEMISAERARIEVGDTTPRQPGRGQNSAPGDDN